MTWNGQFKTLRNLPSTPAEYVLYDVLGEISEENNVLVVDVPKELAERLEKAYQSGYRDLLAKQAAFARE